MKNKILLSLVCGILVLGLATGCGDKSTNIDDNKTNENNQSGENINQEENNSVDLSYTHKVPGKQIYVDVPNWDSMELTKQMMTTVYKIQGSKYVAITDIDKQVDSLSEAYQATFDVFKTNMYRYHPINSISITSEKTEKVNDLEVYRFEGTMNCRKPDNTSSNYDAYVVGYSFIINGVPCSIIGSVQDVKQEQSMIKEMKTTIDNMMKTVRSER